MRNHARFSHSFPTFFYGLFLKWYAIDLESCDDQKDVTVFVESNCNVDTTGMREFVYCRQIFPDTRWPDRKRTVDAQPKDDQR